MKHIVLPAGAVALPPAPPELATLMQDFAALRAATPPASVALCAALLRCSESAIYIIDRDGGSLWSNQAGLDPFSDTASVPATGSYLGDLWSYPPRSSFKQSLALAAKRGKASLTGLTDRAGRSRCWTIEITRVDGDDLREGQMAVVAHEATPHLSDKGAGALLHCDRLTGLAHRDAFHLRLDGLAADASRAPFSVVLIDFNRFRQLNDDLGRNVGDQVLRIFGRRAAEFVGAGDVVARLGGDDFGVILCNDPGALRTTALVAALSLPIRAAAMGVDFSISVGFAHCPDDGSTAAELVQNAETALYEAKQHPDGATVRFDRDLQQAEREHRAEITRAEFALSSGGILAHYQPKVDLALGTIVGFEALLRWRSETGSLEMPAMIWSAFEDPILSRRITDVMLDQILRDIGGWRRLGIDLPVSINISDADLRQGDFADRLLGKLAETDIPASAVEVEITETVLLGRDQAHLSQMLEKLNAAHIRIALDDFGTGYASLAHLKQLPVDVIKIDRSFTRNLRDDPGDRAIVEAMLAMAHKLAIEVVAEGIEHEYAVRFLQDRGCQMGQGYLFGRAVPGDQVPALQAQPPFALTRTDDHRPAGLQCRT